MITAFILWFGRGKHFCLIDCLGKHEIPKPPRAMRDDRYRMRFDQRHEQQMTIDPLFFFMSLDKAAFLYCGTVWWFAEIFLCSFKSFFS